MRSTELINLGWHRQAGSKLLFLIDHTRVKQRKNFRISRATLAVFLMRGLAKGTGKLNFHHPRKGLIVRIWGRPARDPSCPPKEPIVLGFISPSDPKQTPREIITLVIWSHSLGSYCTRGPSKQLMRIDIYNPTSKAAAFDDFLKRQYLRILGDEAYHSH